MQTPKVFADCGVNDPGNSFAWKGAVVVMDWQHGDGSGTTQSSNTKVHIWSQGTNSGAPTDNEVHINSSDQEIGSVQSNGSSNGGTFDQIGLNTAGFGGCASSKRMGHSSGVVLGYGNTSKCDFGCGSLNDVYNWALRCGTLEGNEQTFYYEGVGIPSGARSGGSWKVEHGTLGQNGNTDLIKLVYVEPPPPNPPTPSGACFDIDVPNPSSGYQVLARATDSNNNVWIPSGSSNPSSASPTTSNYQGDGSYPSWKGTSLFVIKHDSNLSNGADRIWRYSPWGTSVTVTLITRKSNGDGTYTTTSYSSQSYTCYAASCTILSATGDGPGGVVVSGGTIHVTAAITNTGPYWLPPSINGWNLGLTGMGSSHPYGGWISMAPPYNPGYMTFDIPAPGGPANYGISFYPDYYGGFPIGSPCTGNAAVYAPFNVSVSADVNAASWENPTTISYDTYVSNSSGVTVYNDPTTSEFYGPHCATAGPVNSSGPWGGGNTYTLNSSCSPSPINAGDTYCAYITIAYTSGYIGPAGDIAGGGGPQTQNPCRQVVNEPYVHFFGADVDAGGGFGNNCTNSPGYINTYTNDNSASRPRGSGSQFGAQALGIIEGFNSAILRGSSPTSPMGLTFANTNASGSPPAATMGGSLGLSNNFCVPDYYGAMPSSATNYAPNVINGSIPSGAQKHSGDLTIQNITTNIADGTANAIYVNGGNVYIKSDIKFANTAWNGQHVSDVPSFYLIVNGGNIYIDPGVKQLDGVYVAQPNGAAAGIINTCSSGAGSYNVTQLYPTSGDGCKNQLTVNGAFVAQQLLLSRAYSSLRYSASGENPQGGSHTCGTAGGGDVPAAGPTSGPDCAAEIFNFGPELYLTQPALKPSSGPTTGRFDYITSLSPVL